MRQRLEEALCKLLLVFPPSRVETHPVIPATLYDGVCGSGSHRGSAWAWCSVIYQGSVTKACSTYVADLNYSHPSLPTPTLLEIKQLFIIDGIVRDCL